MNREKNINSFQQPHHKKFKKLIKKAMSDTSHDKFKLKDGRESELTKSELVLLFFVLSAQQEGANEARYLKVDDPKTQKRISALGFHIKQNKIDIDTEIVYAHALISELCEQAGANDSNAVGNEEQQYNENSEKFAKQTEHFKKPNKNRNEDASLEFVDWMCYPVGYYSGPYCYPCPMFFPYDVLAYSWFKLFELQIQGIAWVGEHFVHAVPHIVNGLNHLFIQGMRGIGSAADSVFHQAEDCFGDCSFADGEGVLFALAAAATAVIVVGGTHELICALEDAKDRTSSRAATMGITGIGTGGGFAALVLLGAVSGPPGWLALGGLAFTSLVVIAAGVLHEKVAKPHHLHLKDEKRLKKLGVDLELAEDFVTKQREKMNEIGFTRFGSASHKEKRELKRAIRLMKLGKLVAIQHNQEGSPDPQHEIKSSAAVETAWLEEKQAISGYIKIANQLRLTGVKKCVRDLLVRHSLQNLFRQGIINENEHFKIINEINKLFLDGDIDGINRLVNKVLFVESLQLPSANGEKTFNHVSKNKVINLTEILNSEGVNFKNERTIKMLQAVSQLVDYGREKIISNHDRHEDAAIASNKIAYQLLDKLSNGEEIDLKTVLRYSKEALQMKKKSKKHLALEPARKLRTMITIGFWNRNNSNVGRFGGYRTDGGVVLAQIREAAQNSSNRRTCLA